MEVRIGVHASKVSQFCFSELAGLTIPFEELCSGTEIHRGVAPEPKVLKKETINVIDYVHDWAVSALETNYPRYDFVITAVSWDPHARLFAVHVNDFLSFALYSKSQAGPLLEESTIGTSDEHKTFFLNEVATSVFTNYRNSRTFPIQNEDLTFTYTENKTQRSVIKDLAGRGEAFKIREFELVCTYNDAPASCPGRFMIPATLEDTEEIFTWCSALLREGGLQADITDTMEDAGGKEEEEGGHKPLKMYITSKSDAPKNQYLLPTEVFGAVLSSYKKAWLHDDLEKSNELIGRASTFLENGMKFTERTFDKSAKHYRGLRLVRAQLLLDASRDVSWEDVRTAETGGRKRGGKRVMKLHAVA